MKTNTKVKRHFFIKLFEIVFKLSLRDTRPPCCCVANKAQQFLLGTSVGRREEQAEVAECCVR